MKMKSKSKKQNFMKCDWKLTIRCQLSTNDLKKKSLLLISRRLSQLSRFKKATALHSARQNPLFASACLRLTSVTLLITYVLYDKSISRCEGQRFSMQYRFQDTTGIQVYQMSNTGLQLQSGLHFSRHARRPSIRPFKNFNNENRLIVWVQTPAIKSGIFARRERLDQAVGLHYRRET